MNSSCPHSGWSTDWQARAQGKLKIMQLCAKDGSRYCENPHFEGEGQEGRAKGTEGKKDGLLAWGDLCRSLPSPHPPATIFVIQACTRDVSLQPS